MADFPQSFKDPAYDAIDADTERRLGLPDGLLTAIRTRGERTNHGETSSAGAKTSYQIIPATRDAITEKYGIDPWLTPENASLGAGYLLKEGLDRNKGDVASAVREYIGGTDPKNHGPTTRSYVNRVMTSLAKPADPQTGSTFDRASAVMQPAIPPNMLERVYAAYQSGQMTPEERGDFEADVKAGKVMLPKGASLQTDTPAAPVPASGALPKPVLDAYFAGKMAPQEMADLKSDVAAGLVKLPAGVSLDKPTGPATQIPGQDGQTVAATGAPGAPQTFGDKLKAAGKMTLDTITHLPQAVMDATETGASVLSGVTGGLAGTASGTVQGMLENAVNGTAGPDATANVEQRAAQGGDLLTYKPKSPTAQAATQTIGKGMQELVALGPLGVPAVEAGGAIARAGASGARAAQASKAAMLEAVKAKVQEAAAARAQAQSAPTPGTMGSVGAAGTDVATMRRVEAQQLPVPIDLTKGQAERGFEQQRFEQEIAKDPNKGQQIRDRLADQRQQMLKNFDAWVDETGAQTTDLRSVGDAVTQALAKRAQASSNEINVAYAKARNSPEARATVNPGEKVSIGEGPQALTSSPIDYLNSKAAGIPAAGLTDAARQYAVKLGIAENVDGQLVARPATVAAMEQWRSAINDATGYEPSHIRDATILKKLIDAQTEPVAGPLYRQARALRTRYAQNFEDIGLVYDLMNEKPGSADAKVAAEDVFRRSVLSSKFEDMRQLRRILQTGGEDGQQAWKELQGAAVRYIREQATRGVGRDERGTPVISVAGMDKAIEGLDKSGKLDYLFGKKGAEQMRAVNELSKVVWTSPPGAVNSSNTASVILAALDMATSGLVGFPAPVMSGLRILTTHVKDRKIQKRINDALGIQPEPKKVKAPQGIVPKPQPSRLPESQTVH